MVIYPWGQYVSVEAIKTVSKRERVGIGRVVSTTLPAILAFVFAILFILPFKITVGCGPFDIPTWAIVLVSIMLILEFLMLAVARTRGYSRSYQLIIGIVFSILALVVLFLPRIPLIYIITHC
jgi:hypothetical protein